ncbi:UNVERIFIED_CONTAM: putative pumilio21 [Sesamum radiatum]|uniref:Pumilio21 n=1 Tax=Sesamum radiatum TaxID=300843 RepID=A0AAW2T211_SESRA
MASSTSQTAGNCLNLSMAADHDEEVILHIGSMKLKKDGTFRLPVAASQIDIDASPSNSDSFSVFSFKTQEEHAPNPITFKNIEIPCVLAQDSSPTHDDILGPRFFMTGVDEYMSEAHNPWHENLKGSMGHQHSSLGSHAPENLAARSSIGQPTVNSLYDHPSTSNFFHQFSSRQLLFGDPRFWPMMPYKFGNHQFRGLHPSNMCNPMNYTPRIPSCLPNDQGASQPFPQAGPLDASHLEEILKGGDYEQKESLVSILEGSIFMLMLDRRLHFLYSMLIDACEGQQLDSLVERVLSQGEYFVSAAFCKQGNVIVQCLVLFRSQPNEILYENAIYHFRDLATHEVGCRSLNDCISLIGGEQRITLLNHIADISDYLSYDPYGNYVVQNLLSLRNTDITNRITGRLQNQFIRLSVIKGGSHVVEKCMEASDNGILAVVEEILDCPKAPFRLARDQFGNYIIQTALKKTKEQGFNSFYNALVWRLEPHRRAICRTTGGKNVLSILEANED